MTMPGDELLGCPFCGAKPDEGHIEPHDHFIVQLPRYPGSWHVECFKCEFRIFSHESRDAARQKWNRRVSHPQPSPDFEQEWDRYCERYTKDGVCLINQATKAQYRLFWNAALQYLKSQPSGREMSKCNNCGCVLPVRYDKCGLCSQGEALLKENAELRKALSAAPGKEG